MESASVVHARLARIREAPQPGDLLVLLLLHKCATRHRCPGIPGPDELVSRMHELVSRQGWVLWVQSRRDKIRIDIDEVRARTNIAVPLGDGDASWGLAQHAYEWARVANDPSPDERNDASFFQAPAFIADPLTRSIVEFLLRAEESRVGVFRCIAAAGHCALPKTTASTRPT